MAKKSRKELLKKDDAFLSAAKHGAGWMSEHRWQVIIGSVAMVVVVAAVWFRVEYVRARDLEASVLLAEALELRKGMVVPPGTEDLADPKADPPTFANEDGKREAVRAAFEAVLTEGEGSGVADLARFYLASSLQEAGDTESATRAFAELLGRFERGDNMRFAVVERVAYLQEQAGDLDAAIETLSQLAGSDEVFYADSAAFHQARLFEKKGETDRARRLLERIESDFPDSSRLEEVKQRLAEIGRTPVATVSDKPGEGTAGSAPNNDGQTP